MDSTTNTPHLSCDCVEPISRWEKFKSVLNYFWHDRKPAIVTVLIATTAATLFIIIPGKYQMEDLLKNYLKEEQLLSTSIQFITFLAILSIWYRTIRKEWRQKLNKYLSVSFAYQDNTRIQCRYAKLSSEADARGMAQSFAQTLNCGGRLDIAPSLQAITEVIKIDRNQQTAGNCQLLINQGQPFLHLDVVIHLINDIETLCENDPDKHQQLKPNQYLQWDYPFAADGINIKTIETQKQDPT